MLSRPKPWILEACFEVYIVRISRRGKKDPRAVTGIAVDPGGSEEMTLINIDELAATLGNKNQSKEEENNE